MLNETQKSKLLRILCYFVLLFLTFISLFPFLILIVNATRVHSEIMKGFSLFPGKGFIQNFVNLFSDKNIPIMRALFNSLFVSFSCAFLTTYFSGMTAYGIHQYQFKGRDFAFRFIMLVMMVPPQVSALGFLRLIMKMDLMDTFYPLIIPALASPVVFFFMLQYMKSILPYEIVEAARIDGSHEVRTFNSIVLPILKPAFAVQAIFAFVGSWNNYFIPALVLNSKEKKTIPILIAQLRSADYMKFDMGKVYMLIFIAIIPLTIVYFFLSKYIIKGITLGSVKG
jgi:ABC-type glycerol-3-phosphate transport system permease component